MIIKAKKQNNFIGVIEGFVCSPIIETSEKLLISKLEDEIYRTCNWLTKNPPKDIDKYIVQTEKVDYNEQDIKFFYNGEFLKNEYKELKSQIVQGYFSLKCMLESVDCNEDIEKFTDILKGIYFEITNKEIEGGLLEVGFILLDVFEEDYLKDQVKTKAYMYKTLYKIVDFAKEFYNNTKDKSKNLTNSFYF